MRRPPRGGRGLKSPFILCNMHKSGSPSSRRAWIEMLPHRCSGCFCSRRPPRGGRGLKSDGWQQRADKAKSPSSRRAWIEIDSQAIPLTEPARSPSSRRAWIEIRVRWPMALMPASRPPRGGRGLKSIDRSDHALQQVSPSSRRAWIEIPKAGSLGIVLGVALLAEGVD